MSPDQFIRKWRASSLSERSASQSHFNDLCDMLGVERPIDADQTGRWYCFERGASKTAGGNGWADVWKRGYFGWEYKGKRKDLTAAYAQLQQYAVALENPPLLIVSDMERFIIHTNWTNTVSEARVINLEELIDPAKRDQLRWAFTEPDRLKPSRTIDTVTLEMADTFASLAISLRERGHDPLTVAHFVNRLVFCMFAEDVGLLPRRIFQQILTRSRDRPEVADLMLAQLFEAMRAGGFFGVDEIEWFNGGLFDSATTLPLSRDDLKIVALAAEQDWSDIDPSIFGTLFERGLDPTKRSQLGAHYTNPEKIMMIVGPTVTDPLWREWERVKVELTKPRTSGKRRAELLARFLERLRRFRILDPACGSGNFLYLALLSLKDLEHRVNLEAEALGLTRQFPSVGPEVVQGIELNPYAAELARVTIWIGEIQWMRRNGFNVNRRPVLRPLDNIICHDALLADDGSEMRWPQADVIIGNPPFLGGRKLKPELGNKYVSNLRRIYGARLADGADLVCYWFDKAAREIKAGRALRAGLVATNSISGGSNRKALETAASVGGLYEVWSDEPWTVEGAAVRVAIVCFSGPDAPDAPRLNGVEVGRILPDLNAVTNGRGADLSRAVTLHSNKNLSFQGIVPRGEVHRAEKVARALPDASFLVPGQLARAMLAEPANPSGRSNSEVLRPYLIGDEITTRSIDRYIVDFGEMTEREAALYEAPFRYIQPVKAHRAAMNQPQALQFWWRHWNSRPKMRKALAGLTRYIATPRVSKHRLFIWVSTLVLPDCQVVAIARDDDVMMGILHSKLHELWSLRMCTYLGVGNDPRYTPSTTFETFPFPPGVVDSDAAAGTMSLVESVADAAGRLDELRSNWLNPPELLAEVRQGDPRVLPADAASAIILRQRTLTLLYNARPAWLCHAHQDLDRAVAKLYGIDADADDEDVLQALLEMNLSKSLQRTFA